MISDSGLWDSRLVSNYLSFASCNTIFYFRVGESCFPYVIGVWVMHSEFPDTGCFANIVILSTCIQN